MRRKVGLPGGTTEDVPPGVSGRGLKECRQVFGEQHILIEENFPRGDFEIAIRVPAQQIIASAATTYGINTNRVYSLGFSNGGFFALLTAMVLNDEIAAFAEAGSGLVTCETTRSCTAEVASSTTCSTIIASSGCSCSGSEKPITIPSSGRKVPGFLGHNNQDDTVSVYYTCYLANRLDDLGYTYEVLIGDEEGHGFPSGFLPDAWEFMSAYELP